METAELPSPRRRIAWAELGLEAFAVFLSVLVGFAVTGWAEVQRERALRATALEQFARELAANEALVRERLPYHEEIHATLSRDAQRALAEEGSAIGATEGWRGPRQVLFDETARRTAEATDAFALLDFETASRLTAVYAMQDELRDVQRALVHGGLNGAMFDRSDPVAALQTLALYFEMAASFERELLGLYETARARVDAVRGEPAAPPAEAPLPPAPGRP